MTTEQDNKISKIKNFKTNIESENTQIKQRISNFQNESKKHSKTFNKGMEQTKKKISDELNSLMNTVDTTAREFEDYKQKTLLSDKDDLNDRLKKLVGGITSGVEKLQKAMIDLSTKQENEVSALYSQMSGKVNTGLTDIYSSQREQVSEFEKGISSRLEKIQRDIVSTAEKESTNQRKLTENIASSFLESLVVFRAKIQDFTGGKELNVDSIFAGTVNDSVGRLELAKEDLLASIDGAMRQLEENCTVQKSNNEEMEKAIKEGVVTGKSAVKTQIETQKTELMEELKVLQNEQVAALSKIQESTNESFKGAMESDESYQSKIITEIEKNLKTSLYNEIDNITLSFTKYQDSIINQIDALISRLTSARDEMKGSLENLLVSNLNKIGGIGKQFEEQLASSFSRISVESKKNSEKVSSKLMGAINERFEVINTSLDSYQDKTSVRLEQTALDLDVSLMNFFDTMQNDISETVSKNSSSLDELVNTQTTSFKKLQTGQEKNLETTLTDIRNTLRNRQSELVTAISSIAPSADDHVDSSRELIEAKKKEITSSSSAAFEDLREKMAAIEKEGMGEIKSIVNGTNQKLDDNVKSSEESTKVLIEGLEDKHKTALAKFRANSTHELKKNQENLENYRTELSGKFLHLFDSQQTSIDLFLDMNRSRKESVDGLRREADIKFDEINSGIGSAIETLNTNINTNTQNVTKSVEKILKNVDNVIDTIK